MKSDEFGKKPKEYDHSIPNNLSVLKQDVGSIVEGNIIRTHQPANSVPVNKLIRGSDQSLLLTDGSYPDWLAKGSNGQLLVVHPSTGEVSWFTPPHARVYQAQTTGGQFQQIASGVTEWVDWTNTSFNNGCTIDISGGDNSSSNYIEVPYDGLYQINSRLSYVASAVPVRIGMDIWNQTTSTIYAEDLRYMPGGAILTVGCSTTARLAAGDKIAVKAYWDGVAGVFYTYADSIGGTGERMNYLDVAWLAP